MPQFTFAPDIYSASKNNYYWKPVLDFKCRGKDVVIEGQDCLVYSKEVKYASLTQRVALIIFTLCLAGLPLASKSLRKIFLKGKLKIYFAVPHKALKDPVAPLVEEMRVARMADRIPSPNAWKRGLGKGEREQTLKHFIDTEHNAHRKKINIFFFDNPTVEENNMLHIVRDYLTAVHGLETEVQDDPVQLNALRKRVHQRKEQYSIEHQMDIIRRLNSNDSFALGFTREDVYPSDRPKINFLFGIGYSCYATGVFSLNRLTHKDPNKTLLRLMKIASHEFAHLRGINHCAEYSCNIQGCNGVKDMDAEPLTYCAQDMAKICYVNNWTLHEGYQNQLNFFENFSENYGINLDFSKEINHLNRKIRKLEVGADLIRL